ncbi:MAG TPA: hypothetical protein VFN10_23690 [Thermoanaerobaculia bacterium]|nr:hypothetical protein [Thermoanaerobaculia bacterium]
MELSKILQVIDAMNREGVEYVTFGAIALAAHGIVRATADADFFIAPTQENVAKLKRALRQVWDDPFIEEINADELLGDYPAVRYCPPDDDLTLDFLTRLGEMYRYEDLKAENAEIEGVQLRVVTARTLYEMKRDTVRSKDRIDADMLRQKFNFGES